LFIETCDSNVIHFDLRPTLHFSLCNPRGEVDASGKWPEIGYQNERGTVGRERAGAANEINILNWH